MSLKRVEILLVCLAAGCGESPDSSSRQALVQRTVEAYDDVAEVLAQMKELTEQAAEAGATGEDRRKSQTEIDRQIVALEQIVQSAQFQGRKVLQGTVPELLGATGTFSTAGVPWARIRKAVSLLQEGNQAVEFTYSFIPAGTLMDQGASVPLADHVDGSLAAEGFKQEIREALAVWEDLLERVFNTAHGYGGDLEVRFIELGDETGNSYPSRPGGGTYPIPGNQNIGDFRYGMEDLYGTASPHSPTGATADGQGDESGDVHFSSNVNWRRDRESTSFGLTSVLIVAVHEMGHGFGFGHDTSGNSMMDPAVIVQGTFRSNFPRGLFFSGSPEMAGVVAMYGAQAKLLDPRPFQFSDGSQADLPAVNAATLGVHALKVRTAEEAKEALGRVAEATSRLAQFRASVEALRTATH